MTDAKPITVGRYLLHRKIARGGMATIHIARLMGGAGFSRIVAAKRMHPELAEDKEFVAMFLDEARIASKVHHRNVVPVLDVVTLGEEVVLVQEYVHGAPLSLLLRTCSKANAHVPIPVAATIACQVLSGLHAAHEATDETGQPLHVVHRDVSPQNIMVATDGSIRLLDFGVAKATVAAHVTRQGTFKGKIAYSSPEQLRGQANKQSDIYALGVVLWEMLVGQRLHANTHGELEQITAIMNGEVPAITDALAGEKTWIGSYRWSQIEALEPIVRKALDSNYRRRWQSAADMEEAITAAVPLASAADLSAWLRAVGKDFLEAREQMIAEEEASWRRSVAMTEAAVSLPTEAGPAERPSRNQMVTKPIRNKPHPVVQPLPATRVRSVIQPLPATRVKSVIDPLRAAKTYSPVQQQRPSWFESVVKPPRPTNQQAAVGVATEAEEVPALRPTLFPRGPAALLAILVVVLSLGIALLLRDLGSSKRGDAPEPPALVTEPPPGAEAARPAAARPARKEVRDEREDRLRDPDPDARSPAAARPAPTVDCRTSFYYEGKKKIVKPGCL